MRVRRFEWRGAGETAGEIREWAAPSAESVDVTAIEREVLAGGDEAVLRLTARFDATEKPPPALRVPTGELAAALGALDPELRAALELAAANVQALAEAQLEAQPREVELSQGQRVQLREVPVGAAGIYAPGGRAAYPSSVLMCAIPARAAGVERLALASPPGPEGEVSPLVLAAAALCGIDEVYAMGGAQAIFALAHGTESVAPVDVIAGPGNVWVREAKRAVYGKVGIDSLAGPSELMVGLGRETDTRWAALDLCAQAEHGPDSPLIALAIEDGPLEALSAEVEALAAERPSVADAPLALVRAPSPEEAIELANAFAPEHLELLADEFTRLAERVRTAGCVFSGAFGATVFGDYVAGSNHVLPTAGAGRFSGPLGPGSFRRRLATVEISAAAAANLAPQANTISRAEGFPVHGESAIVRSS